ncbi:MAG TPA: TIGR01777 family oxidoreductase [Acidimicrobiia bacterium]|nr:TIGR01777 family oxidoreductase [Acidimicrobiia bacterium]
MKVAITGSHGFIGSELVAQLKDQGHEIIPIVRTPVDQLHILWDPEHQTIDAAALDSAHIDAVVHLAGEGIADKKWSEQQKRRILESRTQGTALLVDALSQLEHKPSIFISGSAIGYYGSRGDTELDETSSPGDTFLADVCVQWEEQALKAQDAGIPTAVIRTGIVLDKSGGTLAKMLTPFKLGIGGRIGNGNQYMSWISLEDHIRAITFILDKQLTGAFNLTAPNPVTNKEFTLDLGKRLSRPTLLPTPLLPLKLRYGSELVEALLLGSQRVIPQALLDNGFTFHHETLPDALVDIV